MDRTNDKRAPRLSPALFIHLRTRDEGEPGAKWQKQFDKTWPYYRKWFLSEGFSARPGYLSSLMAFKAHFPELVPTYEKLVELTGNGDLEARYLSQYCPPPYMSGCSQLAWTGERPALIRNYDYSPLLFEGLLLKTNWIRPVIGMVDCSWGLLDGMNADGLCVSLTFGGSRITGEGFGIPLVVRYLLEVCSSTAEAVEVLLKTPVHMAYNLTILDKNLDFKTVYLAPNKPAYVAHTPIGTNHQLQVEWDDYAKLTGTVERWKFLEAGLHESDMSREQWEQRFLSKPLYNTNYSRAFGTLYTAIYDPLEMKVIIRWPDKVLERSFTDFPEEKTVANVKQTASTKIAL